MSSLKPERSKVSTQINCNIDPIGSLKYMFVDLVQSRSVSSGQLPVKRPVFQRQHGVASGEFVINHNLPSELQIGVFAGKEYPVWVRFSSDIPDGMRDYKSTVGIAIKLFNVGGKKLLESDQFAETQDFIMQNHDVFFVENAKEMCEFTKAGVVEGDYNKYLDGHPTTKKVLEDMRKEIKNVLDINYFSIIPSRFGEEKYVKYKLEPESNPKDEIKSYDYNDPHYLSSNLKDSLLKDGRRFRFLVQFGDNSSDTPIDNATIRWTTPFIHVATLIIHQQDITARGQNEYGENLSFNIWHSLESHAPRGSIGEARKVVYEASANLRRNVNGIPIGEPVKIKPQNDNLSAGKDDRIVRAAIYPSIGVARVGNSPNEYNLSPEVLEPLISESESPWDENGGLKRQGVRFRIYGYNSEGNIVRELTSENAKIVWKVHVANKKAYWYRFIMAMDIPEAASVQSVLRNRNIVDEEERKTLILDGGIKTISGKNLQGEEYKFKVNKFHKYDVSIYLGEVRTDVLGRLIFLGGHGISSSPGDTPIYDDKDEESFANADGWYDDICDGPITALVSIDSRDIPVEGAWVLSAPPNYGGNIASIITMYDLLYDAYIRSGWIPFPEKISFSKHIAPFLKRFKNLGWTNKGFAISFGHNSPFDFDNKEYMSILSDKSAAFKETRLQLFNYFRSPDDSDPHIIQWPWIYGDAMAIPPSDSPRQYFSITQTQYQFLRLWVEGKFEADLDKDNENTIYQSIDQVPLKDRPSILNKASLMYCAADAFHPGIELTWPMRHTSIYSSPFRIRHRSNDEIEIKAGRTLTQKEALTPGGPLYSQSPGDLTRWMAIPWQSDTASCRSGYDIEYDPFLPTFWPARVPNHVLDEINYKKIIDENIPYKERIKLFYDRKNWWRNLTGNSAAEVMKDMVTKYSEMGILQMREGVKDDLILPSTMRVESLPHSSMDDKESSLRARGGIELESVSAGLVDTQSENQIDRIKEAGWASEEVMNSFKDILRVRSLRK